MKPLKVNLKFNLKRIPLSLWLAILVGCGINMYFQKVPPFMALCFGFSFLCTSLIAGGPLEMDESGVRLNIGWSQHEIRWDEVTYIEMSEKEGQAMVFYGRNKSLGIAGMEYWTGDDKAAMVELFERQVQARAIPLHRTPINGTLPAKNTRLTRKNRAAKVVV